MSPRRAEAATGIGSSQIAALVGLHPYRDSFDVFNELALGVQGKKRDFLSWGNDLEPAILAYRARQLRTSPFTEKGFAALFGERHLGGTTVRSAESPLALASPDAVFFIEGEEDAAANDDTAEQVEETKQVGYHESWDWGEEDHHCPVGYRLQNLWQQGCLGIHRGELVASVAGAPPCVYSVPFHKPTFENLLIVAERFWHDHVLTKKPPRPIDGSDEASAYLLARYPQETEPMALTCPADVAELAAAWEPTRETRLASEKSEADLHNRICDRIAERVGYVLPDGRWLSWKFQKTGHGGTTRVLRITKGNRKRS